MFATEIVNFCIIQPHHSDIKYSYQCVKDLCVREENECCQHRNWIVANTETGLLPSRFVNLREKWLINITSLTNIHANIYTGNTNCSYASL